MELEQPNIDGLLLSGSKLRNGIIRNSAESTKSRVHPSHLGLRTSMDAYFLPFLTQVQQNAGWNSIITVVSATAIVVLSWQWLTAKSEGQGLPFSVPIPEQCSPGHWDEYDATLYGYESKVLNADSENIDCFCPADSRPLPTYKAQGRDAINTAIKKATNAQSKWAKTTFAQRRQVLRTLLKYVLEHQDDIVTACCLDSGKTRVDAYFGEILVTVEKLQWTIDHGEEALKATKRPRNFLMFYKDNEVRYEPLGVVSACVSWNYPFHNFISPVISAIFAGNSIVVKPSEQVAWSSTFFTNIAKGAIAASGHSHNIVQSVVCLPKDADFLTSHPGISHITFIGSRAIAHKVCASAAKSLTPVTVELGGKDPSIILDDRRTIANLEDVASILMRGVFQNAGQNCIGIERVIALPGVYDKFIEIVKPRIEKLKIGSVTLDERYDLPANIHNDLEGLENSESSDNDQLENGPYARPSTEGSDSESDFVPIPSPRSDGSNISLSAQLERRTPAEALIRRSKVLSLLISPHLNMTAPTSTDLGAMISARGFDNLTSLISSAVQSGAILHHGGKPYSHGGYPRGTYFTPTLLTSVTPSMEIAQQEVFAPIFVLMRAETVDEAISLANSTPYALGASVFGYDDPQAGRVGEVEKCVTGIKAGMVSVNDFGVFYATSLPFGGVKGSGYGRFGGKEGLQALCNIKAVSRDRWNGTGRWFGKHWIGWQGISTKIPPLLDMPGPKVPKNLKKTGDKGSGGSLRAKRMVQGVIGLGYGMGVLAKGKGLLDILAAMDERVEWLWRKKA